MFPTHDGPVCRAIRSELAARSPKLAALFLSAGALVVLGTDMWQLSMRALVVGVPFLALWTVAEVWLARRALRALDDPGWFTGLAAAFCFQAALWGVAAGLALCVYGVSPLSSLMLASTVGLAGAGASSLGVHPRIHLYFTLCLLLPVAVGALWSDAGLIGAVVGCTCMFGVFLVWTTREQAARFAALNASCEELRQALATTRASAPPQRPSFRSHASDASGLSGRHEASSFGLQLGEQRTRGTSAADGIEPQAEQPEERPASMFPLATENLRETLGPSWNREIAERVVDSYLSGWSQRAEQIRSGLHRGEVQPLRDAAHALQGSVCLGLAQVDEPLHRLHEAARQGDLDLAAQAFDELSEGMRSLETSFLHHRG